MIDQTQKQTIVLAAMQMAGPEDGDSAAWNNRVRDGISRIYDEVTSEKSPLMQHIDQLDNSAAFVGHVIAIRREASSTRAIVTLFTGTKNTYDGVPEGCETARTERTDNAYGLHMAKTIRSLVGHRILVRIEKEKMANGSGHTTRVIRSVTDLGLSEEQIAVDAKAAVDAAA